MNYYISRGGQQYGPYSLPDVQKYIAQGSISPSDFARTDTMSNWVPLSQLLAAAAAPPSPQAPPVQQPPAQPQWQPPAQPQPQAAAYGQPVYPAAPMPGMQPPQAPQAGGPVPPSLHWGLVLLFSFLSCFLFGWVWIFIQAAFVKKIRPAADVMMLYIGFVVLAVLGDVVAIGSAIGGSQIGSGLGNLLSLAALAMFIVANFKVRTLLLEYYNTVEPINLRLSGVMTFFFNIYYFQYHFTRIAEWKRTGVLTPQQLR